MAKPENPFNHSLTFVGSFQMGPAELTESLPVRQLLQWALTTAVQSPNGAGELLASVTAELVARDELQLAAILLAQFFAHSQQGEEDGDTAAAAYRELQHDNHHTVRWLLVLTVPVAGYPRERIGALVQALELAPAAV